MSQESVERSGPATGLGPLDVRLAVDVDTATGCPLSGRDLDEVRQSVTRSDRDDGETCRVAIDDGACDYRRTPVDDACPCAILDEHDCISDLESVRDGRLLFSLVVPDREVLRSVIDDLRAIGVTVSIERIRTDGVENDASADGVALTRKQREALALALESGYYDRPRGTTLDDLADELEITPSAVSQRLNAIERKLVCGWADEFDLR